MVPRSVRLLYDKRRQAVFLISGPDRFLVLYTLTDNAEIEEEPFHREGAVFYFVTENRKAAKRINT